MKTIYTLEDIHDFLKSQINLLEIFSCGNMVDDVSFNLYYIERKKNQSKTWFSFGAPLQV